MANLPNDLPAVFRMVAEGRREYAVNAPPEMAAVLETQAAAFECAAKIAEGDKGPLYGLLPSWRWTDDMDRGLANGMRR